MPSTPAGLEDLDHPAIDRLLEGAARQLGLAASWMVNTVDPRAVLLGGSRPRGHAWIRSRRGDRSVLQPRRARSV